MDLCCVVARPSFGSGFLGRRISQDGNPKRVGRELWRLYHHVFHGDLREMLHVLIDQHPAGWHTIAGDWSKPIGNSRTGDSAGPQCYCHGQKVMPRWDMTERNVAVWRVEFLYLLYQDGIGMPTLRIQSSYLPDGAKYRSILGGVKRSMSWHQLGTFRLCGTEPEWKDLEQQAYGGN